jgi:hypothetical protein
MKQRVATCSRRQSAKPSSAERKSATMSSIETCAAASTCLIG